MMMIFYLSSSQANGNSVLVCCVSDDLTDHLTMSLYLSDAEKYQSKTITLPSIDDENGEYGDNKGRLTMSWVIDQSASPTD